MNSLYDTMSSAHSVWNYKKMNKINTSMEICSDLVSGYGGTACYFEDSFDDAKITYNTNINRWCMRIHKRCIDGI